MDIIENYKSKLSSQETTAGIFLNKDGSLTVYFRDTPFNMYHMFAANVYKLDQSGFTYSASDDTINFVLSTSVKENDKFRLSQIKTEISYSYVPENRKPETTFSIWSNEVNLMSAIFSAVGNHEEKHIYSTIDKCIKVVMSDSGETMSFSIIGEKLRSGY